MTDAEWLRGWQDIRDIMDSENGEESMPHVCVLAAKLARRYFYDPEAVRVIDAVLKWRKHSQDKLP